MRAGVALVAVVGCSFNPGVLPNVPSDAADASVQDAPDGAIDGAPGSARKKTITIAHQDVLGNLTGFPVWFVLDDPNDLGMRATANGADIHFTLPNGSPLAYERVRWDKATGHLEAWVKLDLADSSNTVFELRYGDPGRAHGPDPAMVFSEGFAAVWHFDDTLATTAVADARNQYPGTALNGLGSGAVVAGKLGRGFDFDGTNDEVSFTNMLLANSSHTISAWIKVAAPTTGFGSILTVGTASGGQSRWLHSKFQSDLCAGFYGPDYYTNTVVANDTFTLVHWVYDAGNVRHLLYRNAVEVDNEQVVGTINTVGTAGHIGNAPNAWGPGGNTPNPINGIVDEVRIAIVPRSAGWLSTEYRNQNAPATFYTVGAEQILP